MLCIGPARRIWSALPIARLRLVRSGDGFRSRGPMLCIEASGSESGCLTHRTFLGVDKPSLGFASFGRGDGSSRGPRTATRTTGSSPHQPRRCARPGRFASGRIASWRTFAARPDSATMVTICERRQQSAQAGLARDLAKQDADGRQPQDARQQQHHDVTDGRRRVHHRRAVRHHGRKYAGARKRHAGTGQGATAVRRGVPRPRSRWPRHTPPAAANAAR
jgi:hypothetical protein